MSFKINNEGDEAVIYQGQTIAPGAFYTVPDVGTSFASDTALISDIIYGNTSITIKTNTLRGKEALSILTMIRDASVSVSSVPPQSPFASKTIGTKSLFRRLVGITQSVTTGETTITWATPYPWAKIIGMEIIGATAGDTVNFYVLDSATGAYSGLANRTLNQFGFNVNIAPDYYLSKSEYDADVYQGMQFKMEYTSVSNKTVGINFLLNELK